MCYIGAEGAKYACACPVCMRIAFWYFAGTDNYSLPSKCPVNSEAVLSIPVSCAQQNDCHKEVFAESRKRFAAITNCLCSRSRNRENGLKHLFSHLDSKYEQETL
jgi:hypothetical protein